MRSLAVHAIGAYTGVGADAPSTMASLLTQVQARVELSFGNETTSGAAIAFPPKPSGTQRLLGIAGSALGEVSGADLPWPLPLVLCCPGPDEIPCAAEELLARLVAQEPTLVAAQACRVFPGGRRDLPEAVAAVGKTLASSSWPFCVLLGVDSLLGPSRLAIVDHRRGLRSVERPDGVLPGEAAVALLLGPSERARARPQVASLIAGQVPAASLPGAALAALVERALAEAGVQAAQVGSVLHDLTGPAGLEELHSMMSRIPLAGVRQVFAPGDITGETGAASAILTLAVTAFFREKGVYEGAGLAIASDETGFRSVAVVRTRNDTR
jgi:3-oxoacyl-[acyl-carrier-protein] synthase-1